MERWRLRTRALVGKYATVLAAVALVLAGVGGWVAYTANVAPGTHVEERTAATWEPSGTVRHQATVTEPNPVFDRGTVLRNRSGYLTAVAPVVRVRSTAGYTASGSGRVDVAVDAALVRRAVAETTDGQARTETAERRVYWRTRRPLASERAAGVVPGEPMAVAVELNASRATNQTQALVERLGGSPGEVQTVVVFDVSLEGTVNGRAVERTWRAEAVVDATESSYSLAVSNAVPEGGQTVERVTVPNRPGPVRRSGGPVVAALGLAGLVGLAWARRDDRLGLSAAERDRLAYLDDRREFDEWITTIALSAGDADRPRARAASLADLANFAIDADAGIVEDPARGVYAAVHDGTLYVYEPPGGIAGDGEFAGEADGDESDADVTDGAASDSAGSAPAPDDG